MTSTSVLQPGMYYHIFNRGNNREKLFYEERNYAYFMRLYARYVLPVADTYAYCLMSNHYHFLLRIKTEEEYNRSPSSSNSAYAPSKHLSNLFNAYAKAINKAYGRTGSLFQEHFHRIEVNSDSYLLSLVFYIHYNPQKHGYAHDFRDWRWSSYAALIAGKSTHLSRDEVLGWFGGVGPFVEFHQGMVNEKSIAAVIDEI